MEWLLSSFQNLLNRLYLILFPLYASDVVSTRIHSQGRFVIFALSQAGALVAALIVLSLYGATSFLIGAVMVAFIAAILLNFLFVRLGIFAFATAALLFAGAAYCAQTLLILKSELQPIIVYGFFPSVIGGFLFLGIRMGSIYAVMFAVLLTLYHLLYDTAWIEFVMQMCAIAATFMIAFFYEMASVYHMSLLSLSLEKMTRLAKTDQLTGILNRWEFFYQATKGMKEHPEGTMMMIDLDDFKSINDTYGHGIGDLALKSLAQTIKSYIRETELFGRIGGEEFAILLPVGLHSAYKRAEVIRQAVSELQFNRENVDLRLSISIGMTSVLQSDTSVSQILNRADKGLYKAKESGKNVTVIWNE